MVPNTKASGVTTKPMARESSGTQMAMSMKEIGRMTRLMVSVSMSMLTELNMKDIGRTICRMAGELRAGQMAASTKVATKKA
jgi:hypothetical protein